MSTVGLTVVPANCAIAIPMNGARPFPASALDDEIALMEGLGRTEAMSIEEAGSMPSRIAAIA